MRTEHVDDADALESTAAQYVTEHGYKLKHDGSAEKVLKEKGGGSIWWHLLFLFTTAGFGNLLYYVYCRWQADRVRVRIKGVPFND